MSDLQKLLAIKFCSIPTSNSLSESLAKVPASGGRPTLRVFVRNSWKVGSGHEVNVIRTDLRRVKEGDMLDAKRSAVSIDEREDAI